jgi:hypothetical protein
MGLLLLSCCWSVRCVQALERHPDSAPPVSRCWSLCEALSHALLPVYQYAERHDLH